MTVKETYRHLLTVYPTLFSCPLDVSCHLFCLIGNGYEWKNGELINVCGGREAFEGFRKIEPCFSEDLNTMWRLQEEAQEIKYKFILDNMEDVLKCPISTSFFDHSRRAGYYETKPCVKYSRAVNFPDDITEDWAVAVKDFLNWWLLNLNQHYMVGPELNTSHWPKEITESYNVILEARNKIQKGYQWRLK